MFQQLLAQIEDQVTRDLFARTFTEWDRRYREDPAAFDTAATGQTYGERSADYFITLLNEEAR